MKRFQPAEKGGDHWETLLSRAPEDGMLARVRNLKRLLRSKSDQAVMPRQPILGKHADVDVNANRCPSDPDRMAAVLKNRGRVHLFLFPRKREGSPCHFLGHRDPFAFSEQEDCVY